MKLVPDSETAIEARLAPFRAHQRNVTIRVGGALIGFALGLPLYSLFQSLVALFLPLPAGWWLIYAWERKEWPAWVRRLREETAISLGDDYLEVRGFSQRRFWHVRFRYSEIAAIRIGPSSRWSALRPGIAQEFDALAMVIEERTGFSMRFEYVAAIFRPEELSALSSRFGVVAT